MRYSIILIGLILCVLCISFFIFFTKGDPDANEGKIDVLPHDEKCTHALTSLFYDDQLFWHGINSIKESEYEEGQNIRGAIVPHHLLPSFIIADLFEKISRQKPEMIILIGPNHDEKGEMNVISSVCDWETPFDIVLSVPDNHILCEQHSFISCNKSVLDTEHSMGSMMPFVAYYMPDARVLPLVISQKITTEEKEVLAQQINEKMHDQNVVLVASVDFSHYLSSMEAEENDRQTIKAIEERDHAEIDSYGNEHIDSPQSIDIFLRVMDALRVRDMEVLYNTNSGRLVNDPYTQTTSYFGILFR